MSVCGTCWNRFCANEGCVAFLQSGGEMVQSALICNEIDRAFWVEEAGLDDGDGEIIGFCVADMDKNEGVGF